jgi:hypothetical protein
MNSSFGYFMRISAGFYADEIGFAAIEHDDQSNLWQGIICVLCSSVETTNLCFVADLQLIKHDSHAHLQLIRAEHLPDDILNRAVKSGNTTVGPG